MQHWLRSPPGFVVVEVIFGKATHVDDAELRVDRGPSVGRGLAAIIETGPGKAACKPFARRVKLPPLLGELRPVGVIPVVETVLAVSLPTEGVFGCALCQAS